MKLNCPRCGSWIDPTSVNVAADIAKCENCGELFKASELVEATEDQSSLEPPAGTKIVFTRRSESDATFRIPCRGLKAADLFIIVFAAFWLGFVAFWTFMAVQGSVFFAMFSIPFWIVGIGMWVGILNSIFERQVIDVTVDEVRIHKQRPVASRLYAIPYVQIQSISLETVVPKDPITAARHVERFSRASGTTRGIDVPIIAHGTKKTTFVENVSEAEQKWLVAVLRAIVREKTGRSA